MLLYSQQATVLCDHLLLAETHGHPYNQLILTSIFCRRFASAADVRSYINISRSMSSYFRFCASNSTSSQTTQNLLLNETTLKQIFDGRVFLSGPSTEHKMKLEQSSSHQRICRSHLCAPNMYDARTTVFCNLAQHLTQKKPVLHYACQVCKQPWTCEEHDF